MRPRVFPAEDYHCSAAGTRACGGFNEAAGIPRGRRHLKVSPIKNALPRFNEAAGIPRGRPCPNRVRLATSLELQ